MAGDGVEAHDGGGMAGMMQLEAWPLCDGQMEAWSARLHGLKRASQGGIGAGQRGKGIGPVGHSASLVCFSNFFEENVKLQKGLGKIIYRETDGVIYLTQKMKDELIHHSNCNQIVLHGRNCITFLSFYQSF